MDTIRTIARRLSAMFRRTKLDAQLEEELKEHIELSVEAKTRQGMSPQAARTAALREFGGVTQIRERYREQRGLPFTEVLLRDIRFSLRQLRKSPGFTITIVLSLAIGIGANTAIFSMMDAVVFRPLAVPDLDRVVTVAEEQGRGDYRQVALANYESWKRENHSFEDLAVRSAGSLSLTGSGEAIHIEASFISPNFFRVLRTDPLLGRNFQEGEAQAGRDGVVLLSYGFWKKHFNTDPAILGRILDLDGRAYSVIGVMPQNMRYPSVSEVFLPLAPTSQERDNRIARNYQVIGRLRSGVGVNQAQEDIRLIASRLATMYPATNQGWSARVEPLLDVVNGDTTPLYFRMILAASGFVLLVVCANVANLQFVRGIARRPEIAVRVALGAGRARLLRQLLTESILLGIMGALGGLGVAAVWLHLCIIAMPERVARYIAGWSNISLNGRALAFSLLLAIATGIISGLLPAIKSLGVNLVDQLKAGSRTTSGSRGTHRLRDFFAVAQISLSVLLIVGAALMCKGMWSLLHVADTYKPKQMLTFSMDLPLSRYGTEEKQAAWFKASLDKLRALPGVTHAEITTSLPDGQDQWTDDFRIENRPLMPGKFQSASRLAISSGYFAALHVPVYDGRTFNAADTLETPTVAMVSKGFAERYFPGENVIGKRIQMGAANSPQSRWMRIVGVVGDVNYLWIDRAIEPAVYINSAQMPPWGATYMVTTDGSPLALTGSVRAALASLDATVPIDSVQTYDQYLTESLAGLIYVAVTLSVNAFIGLLLAAMGIFGVMANLVAERTREIGVRIAMGASPQDMLRMILRRAALLSSVGVAAGIVLAAALARLSANLLFGVRPDDPLVFGSITAAVVVITLLVSWGPARKAASIDPMRALRAE